MKKNIKNSLKNILSVIPFLVISTAYANKEALPPVPVSAYEEQEIWNDYCGGDRNSTEIPKPNYNFDEIKSVVRKLAMISPYSYYFYSGPLYAYELRKGKDKELVPVPADFPDVPEVKNGKKNAHAFLTLLCGEFRDRPSLIRAKIKWIGKMVTLKDEPQKKINLNKDLWTQMSAHSYEKYIQNTKQIFRAKEMGYQKDKYVSVIGKLVEPFPIEPFTVCETKFIFDRYVNMDRTFNARKDSIAGYKKEYGIYKKRCLEEDLSHFYDFRGDSNFKPNSPESNGMIWYSSSISNSCIRKDNKMVLKDSAKDKFPADQQDICEKYFTSPFAYRWSAARAGLATWLLRDTKHDAIFSQSNSNVTIIPNFNPMEKPFQFKFANQDNYVDGVVELYKNTEGKFVKYDYKTGQEVVMTDEEVKVIEDQNAKLKAQFEIDKKLREAPMLDLLPAWLDNKEFWMRSDLGYNDMVGFSGKLKSSPDKVMAFMRLRDAVNRHTDWYASGYDDGLGTVRTEAYSPFVASSYEMSASDTFTAPGVTVKSPADGCKHWMFVFKLKNDQWYSTESIKNKVKIDFNRHWFDETSLGNNHLADSERALDRLGTALEGEMDSILYLNNISTSGEVNEKCGEDKL